MIKTSWVKVKISLVILIILILIIIILLKIKKPLKKKVFNHLMAIVLTS
jgi:hypothetical protein